MDQQFKEEFLSNSTRGRPDSPRSPLSVTTLDDGDRFDCLENDSFDIVTEGWKLLHIALPTVALQVSVFSLFPQTASAIGRKLGSEALAAFSLATLVGNITCLSILIGTLSATETLQPRAYALGNYPEVGKIAIRATFVCTLLLLPFVLALALWTESILVYLGQDATASRLAKEWVRIYLCGLPATIIFRVTQRFMGAQHIVWPMVYSAMLSSFVVHPILLHFLVDAFGFSGSALAVAATQTIQSILVLIYLKIKNLHHPATWPGLTRSYISEAIQNKTMLQFIKLGLGGVLSWSEWWFWETMCFTAGKFGVIPLCVHTVAYQLIPICWMVPFGTSIALSIRIGCILPVNASSAQRLASWCMVCSILWASFVAILVYILQPFLVPLLTTDNAVIEGCAKIWFKVCLQIFIVSIFGINGGILRALGLQWKMALSVCVVLWCAFLPIIYWASVTKGGGLESLWTLLPTAYAILNITLFFTYYMSDWQRVSDKIKSSRENIACEQINNGSHDIWYEPVPTISVAD